MPRRAGHHASIAPAPAPLHSPAPPPSIRTLSPAIRHRGWEGRFGRLGILRRLRNWCLGGSSTLDLIWRAWGRVMCCCGAPPPLSSMAGGGAEVCGSAPTYCKFPNELRRSHLMRLQGCSLERHAESNMRTKVRRLYDIANVLSSLNLIEKTQQVDSRKPAFRWLTFPFILICINWCMTM
ncbi:hypothetical protein BRADI_1g38577v3 [Brachypodium distachyon]|uniref:E2F/DP family winged-helix DNA-binding domain-containing protein n=1 Tax=Brachypodium distachyon TaxID=15368 RepID=A0A0Q3JKE9_BRADI|nr:hypothetical protein BRADI_1g38577v3 [Brachypodium distachyon]